MHALLAIVHDPNLGKTSAGLVTQIRSALSPQVFDCLQVTAVGAS